MVQKSNPSSFCHNVIRQRPIFKIISLAVGLYILVIFRLNAVDAQKRQFARIVLKVG